MLVLDPPGDGGVEVEARHLGGIRS
jgi:hypothetical protein